MNDGYKNVLVNGRFTVGGTSREVALMGGQISDCDHDITRNKSDESFSFIFSSTHHNCQNWISLFEFCLIQPNSFTPNFSILDISIMYCLRLVEDTLFVT